MIHRILNAACGGEKVILIHLQSPLDIFCECHDWPLQAAKSPALTSASTTPTTSPIIDCLFLFYSGAERTTIIIIHHAAVRVEPVCMTAIQGGGQRPSTAPPPPTVASSGMTQTPPTGGPLSPVTVPATRRPLLLPHKATGSATTQTRTTNVPPHPPNQRHAEGALRSSLNGLLDVMCPWTALVDCGWKQVHLYY